MKYFPLSLLGLACLPLLSACTAQYVASTWQNSMESVGLRESHQLSREAEWGISRSSHIALHSLSHAAFHSDVPRSAMEFNRQFLQSFQQVFPHTSIIDATSGHSLAMRHAAINGCDILLVPKLIGIENNLNTWDELHEGPHQHPGMERGRDLAQMHILIYEVQTGRLIDRVALTSRGAYLKNGDVIPLDLFSAALQIAARSLGRMPNT